MKNTFKRVIVTCKLVLASVIATGSVGAVAPSIKPALSTTEKKQVEKQAKSKRKGVSRKINQKSRLKRKESKISAPSTGSVVTGSVVTGSVEAAAPSIDSVVTGSVEAAAPSIDSVVTGSVEAAAPLTARTVENGSGQTTGEVVHSEPMRGAWIATVQNIDWPPDPKKFGFNAEAQKEALVSEMDELKAIGITDLFFQVLPASDTFYPSELLPWSKYLTGEQGKDPGYDPLKFALEEAHKRGMKLHVWCNPVRIDFLPKEDEAQQRAGSHPLQRKDKYELVDLVDGHPAKRHPEWTVEHKPSRTLLYDLGIPEVIDFTINCVMELLEKYDVDGMHMDDRFYPYGENLISFNDNNTYNTYNKGKFTSKEAWRRDNCSRLVEGVSKAIKALNEKTRKNNVKKPYIKFGISPFGIWRNKNKDERGSATDGLNSYDAIFTDSLLWVKEGWLHYIAPQIYWHIGHPLASYDTLADWWVKQTKGTGVDLYIGHAAYKLADDKETNWGSPDVLIDQLIYNKKHGDAIKGDVFFSAKNLVNNTKQVATSLKQYYDAEKLAALPFGRSVTGNLKGNMQDGYSLDIPSAGNYEIVVQQSNEEEVAWQLFDYKDRTKPIAYPDANNQHTRLHTRSVDLQPGKYILVVYKSSEGKNASYTVQMNKK